MKQWAPFTLVLLGLLVSGPGFTEDADDPMDKDMPQMQAQDKMMYGWQLMTVEERAKHRAKMQSLNTKEEREAYRLEHHKLMQARAKERGITLPEQPMPHGGGGPGGRGGGGGPMR